VGPAHVGPAAVDVAEAVSGTVVSSAEAVEVVDGASVVAGAVVDTAAVVGAEGPLVVVAAIVLVGSPKVVGTAIVLDAPVATFLSSEHAPRTSSGTATATAERARMRTGCRAAMPNTGKFEQLVRGKRTPSV